MESRRAPLPGKDLADHVFNRHFFNINVGHRKIVQERLANRNDTVTLDLELETAGLLLDQFPIAGKVLLGAILSARAVDGDELEIGEAIHDLAEQAIEKNRAVVDDDNPPA